MLLVILKTSGCYNKTTLNIFNWLQKYNTIIDWSKSTLLLTKCYIHCRRIHLYQRKEPEEIEKTFDNGLDRILFVNLEEEIIR